MYTRTCALRRGGSRCSLCRPGYACRLSTRVEPITQPAGDSPPRQGSRERRPDEPVDGVGDMGTVLHWIIVGILIVIFLIPWEFMFPRTTVLIVVLLVGYFFITQPAQTWRFVQQTAHATFQPLWDLVTPDNTASATPAPQQESKPDGGLSTELWHATVYRSKDSHGNDTGVRTYTGPTDSDDDKKPVLHLFYRDPLVIVCKTNGREYKDPSFGNESSIWYRLEGNSYINEIYVNPQDEGSPPECRP